MVAYPAAESRLNGMQMEGNAAYYKSSKFSNKEEQRMELFVDCVVSNCSNMKLKEKQTCLDKRGNPVFFYQFPQDKDLRQKWLDAAGRKIVNLQAKMTICSEHFDKSCFAIGASSTVGKKIKLLKKNAVPTIALPSSKSMPNILRNPMVQSFQLPKFNPKHVATLQNFPGATNITANNLPINTQYSPEFIRSLLGKEMSNNNPPVLGTIPQINLSPQKGTAQASGSPTLMIKNDLTKPVMILKAPDKLLVSPMQSAATNKLALKPNSSCVQVNPNSFITMQPPKIQNIDLNSSITAQLQKITTPVKQVRKIPECTCPTDKFFREGSKQIRILTEEEGRLRFRLVKKARLLKSLQLSRIRGEEKVREIKKTVKDLKRDIEKKDRGVLASSSTIKFFREIVKRHNKPINLDGPVRTKYGRETKKFAIQLFSYSPEAYRYVREAFDKRLPRSKMILKWCLKAKESVKATKKLDLTSERLDQIIDWMNARGSELDSDLSDESVTSAFSSDEEDEKVKEKIKNEIHVNIETKADAYGNVINLVPANLEDEVVFSDSESDSDFEMMSFTTLCDSGPIIPMALSNANVTAQPTLKQHPETVFKVNPDATPKMIPGARFETFAI